MSRNKCRANDSGGAVAVFADDQLGDSLIGRVRVIGEDQREMGDAGAGNDLACAGDVLPDQLVGAAGCFVVDAIKRGQRRLRVEINQQGSDV